MFGSTVLEVALGLVFLYGGLALVVASAALIASRLPALREPSASSAWRRQRMQLLLLVLAVGLAAALNADTILVVRGLSGAAPARPALRAAEAASGAVSTSGEAIAARAVQDRTGVFISYSHRDTAWLDELRVALKPVERAEGLAVWDDRQIAPGQQWEREILDAIARSRVAVLLVSPDFLASDYVANVELPVIMEQRDQGLSVLWVPVRHSAYDLTVLGTLQAATNPSTPLAAMSETEQDRAFVGVAARIAAAALGRAASGQGASGGAGVFGAAGGAGLPLGWGNAYEDATWEAADVTVKVAGLALTALAVFAVALLWYEALSRASLVRGRVSRPPD